MDPMDVDDERASAPDVEPASASLSGGAASPASEPSDTSASKEPERPEEPANGTSYDTRPLDVDERSAQDERDGLAVTAPLKSRITPQAVAGLVPSQEEPATAEADEADEADEAQESAPLEPGATLAGYTIERVLRVENETPVYLAIPPAASEPADEEPAAETPPWRYIAREVPASDAERLERVVAAGVREPGLLAPVAFAREGKRTFLISVELPGSGEGSNEPAPPLGVGERLRPVDALTACSQLANALAALHRGELAHLHVSPDRVTLYDGRVYLTGVEDATPVTDPEEGQALYARDANFLARTVGSLGGADDVTLWDRDSSAQRSLREIAARGETGGFATIDEVVEASTLALQTLLVAGARMGADVRAVRLRISSGAATSIGRIRSENQDAWGAALFDIHDDAAADAPLGVFLVADGMGGESHGEIASRFVVRTVTTELARRFIEPQTVWPAQAIFTAAADDAATAPQVPLTQALEQAVKEANRRTRSFATRLNATTGSTVTALAIAGARAALAHLGDSRAYLLRDGQLIQLTEDHSLLARLEAMRHPALEDPSFMMPRSVLYRSIGQEDDATPDMLQFVLAPGDRLVICSDGLWDEVTSEGIGQALGEATDPDSCAAALVARANANGGHDNSTAVVLFVSALPVDQPFGGATPEATPDSADDGPAASPAADSEAPVDETATEEAGADAPEAGEMVTDELDDEAPTDELDDEEPEAGETKPDEAGASAE